MTDQIKDSIIENLREVYDPELPINVYDLGLIYKIDVDSNKNVSILMTLTSPTCPTADYIKTMIQEAAEKVEGVVSVSVELTFEPRWTPKLVSKEAREELGLSEEPEEDVALTQTFGGDFSEKSKLKVCFKCGVTENERPVLGCWHKGEETYICTKCMQNM